MKQLYIVALLNSASFCDATQDPRSQKILSIFILQFFGNCWFLPSALITLLLILKKPTVSSCFREISYTEIEIYFENYYLKYLKFLLILPILK